jgi:galactitol-specific phosphotransferase system IIB component
MADLSKFSNDELLALAAKQRAKSDLSRLSNAELEALLAEKQGAQQSNPLWSGFDQFGSGFLQGMGDELKAATAASKEYFSGRMPFSEAYSQALPQYQRAREDYRKANPVKGPALEMGGAVAPWLLSGGLLPPAAAGANIGAKVLHGAKIGAGTGAVSGGLMAEGDILDRAKGAVVGGTLGGTLGAVATPVIAGAVGTGKFLINQIVSRLPHQQRGMASRKIAEALARDGLTPDQAAAKLQEMGPNASILDLGVNTRALAGTAQQTPGSGKTAITDFLVNRQHGVRDADKVIQGGQINRVTGQIDDLVPGNFADTKAGFATARKTLGREYDAARDGDDLVDVAPLLKNLVNEIEVSKGGIKAALEKVLRLIVDEKGRPEVTINTLHQAKMAIDDLMSGEARASMGNVAKGRVREYQNALLDAIESSGESGAAYRAGRTGTRGEWLKDEALESGGNFIRAAEYKRPEVLDLALSKMTAEELHAFRIGAAQALKQEIGGRTNVRQDVVKKLMDMPDLEKKIRAAFGDDELFRKYITGLEGEGAMFKSYSMMGGSPTAERTAAQADAVIDPSRIIQGFAQMHSTNPLNWIGGGAKILGGAKDRVLMPEKMSEALGGQLTGRSVKALKEPYRIQGKNKEMIEALSRGSSVAGGVYGGRQSRDLIKYFDW